MKGLNNINRLFEAYIYYVYINKLEKNKYMYVFYMSKNEIFGSN